MTPCRGGSPQIAYSDTTGKLTIQVKSARSLRLSKTGAIPSPYVKVCPGQCPPALRMGGA